MCAVLLDMRSISVIITVIISLLACAEVFSLELSSRGLRASRTSALASILEVRGGASRKKKAVGARQRKSTEDESDGDEDDAETSIEKGYTPKKKNLVSTLVTFAFRLLVAVLSPLLPSGLVKKLQGKKAEVAVAGRTSTTGSVDRESKDKIASKKKTGAAGKLSSMTQEHLEKSFTKGDANNRVQKELRAFLANPPDNCKLMVGANIRVWIVQITGAEGTIFAGEKYKLKMVFPKEYPAKPPSVYFLKPTPRHVHVYSNGDICLNLLGKDWRPTMSAQLLVVSIYSMLSSAKEKKIPQDNAMHADNPPGQQQEGWMYHDDRC